MKQKDIIIQFARSQLNSIVTRSSQELRYTTDGVNWAKMRSFATGEIENVVMGTNYYIQFTATDNYSARRAMSQS